MDSVTVPVEETWKLDDLFANDAEYRVAKQSLEGDLTRLGAWRGRLAEGGAVLAEALEHATDARKRFALLHCYTSLKSDTDIRDATNQAMRQQVELLATDLSGRLAYLRPEILAIAPEVLEGFIRDEPRLEAHAFFLRDLMRSRDHVLSREEENIIAETGLLSRGPSALYQVLNNAELPRPEVTFADGETVPMTPVEFHKRRSSQNRADRMAAFEGFFGSYASFRDSLAQNLYTSIKAQMFRTRVRKYDSCLAAALDSDNVPTDVYRNLIRQVRERLPLLHRYLRLRARVLGQERLSYPDLYCPLVSTPPARYSPQDARRLVSDSLRPIGPDYTAALDDAFGKRWIDWHPGPGKRSGAYATGWAYDVHPYVLVNYNADYESVSTLAHEMGHAMHSYFSNRAQPFCRADYSIFVAEVASTVNEALLSAGMLREASTDDEKRFLLASYLDGIRGTLFRQTMFADFELDIHERAERGEVLTGEKLNELYLKLLREYHGHDEGVMDVADDFAIEWAAIPHFYYDFYVYQYSTGIVAATALTEALTGDTPGAAARYMGFLRAGGSDHPLDLLRQAGVDLEHAEPYDAAFRAIERQLELLENLLPAAPS